MKIRYIYIYKDKNKERIKATEKWVSNNGKLADKRLAYED